MRISIQSYGTRGDVQPYMALALELIRRHHTVQLAGPSRYADLAKMHSVPFTSLPDDLLALLDTPEGRAAIAKGGGFLAGVKLLPNIRPLMGKLLNVEWDALQAFTPDLIVYDPKSLATPHMAEALHSSCIQAALLPAFTPTAEFPSPLLPSANLGRFNRLSHQLALFGAARMFRKEITRWREMKLRLSGGTGLQPRGTLYACSSHVVPKPADWPLTAALTGYWFLDEPDWKPNPQLSHFLAAGDPPIFVGFGSMLGVEPLQLTQVIISALAASGKRGLLAIAGGALTRGATAPHIHFIDEAPHGQLFPFVSGVIHHGGAGTTSAALRAGKPMVICPYFGDQPYWGRLMAELGVAPAPLEEKPLTVDKLTRGICFIANRSVKQRARDLGRAIAAENGTYSAAELIERWMESPD